MWTDAAIETLRQMALEGKSASAIAAALGAPSRNAVIGKANRIGIKLTGHVHCSAQRAPRSVIERPRRPAIARTEALWKRASVPALPRERKPTWAFAGAEVGEMLKVGLEDIGEGLPLAARRSGERGFRLLRHRKAKGRSYCAGHCRLAYKPPNARVWDGERYVALEFDRRLTPPRRPSLSAGRMGARGLREGVRAGRDLYVSRHRRLSPHGPFRFGRIDRAPLGSSIMSNASFSRPLGTAMVGGALAMAILDLLVRKNILTVDDAQGALTTAQSSLIGSPAVQGSLDGARIIGEIKDVFARRERGQWSERRG